MRRAALALVLLMVVGCSNSAEEPTPATTLVIHATGGDVTLEVEIADSPEEREIGLMDREHLDPYDGMAFVWDEPVRASFWMKDTLIPLSIAFWDEGGEIVAMFDMDPCEAEPCRSYAPEVAVVGALEVDQGRLASVGVEVGDLVEIPER